MMERQHPIDHLTERDPFDEEVMLEMGGEIDHVEARRKELYAVVHISCCVPLFWRMKAIGLVMRNS